jgi:outer membrane protein assembly factor BamE (lipoprotein component of BamABCDE complex)
MDMISTYPHKSEWFEGETWDYILKRKDQLRVMNPVKATRYLEDMCLGIMEVKS